MATLDSDVTVFPAGEASSSAGPSSSTKKPKRFEIKKWNAVSLWAWGSSLSPLSTNPNFLFSLLVYYFLSVIADIVVDNCAICRNHIMDLCKRVNSTYCLCVVSYRFSKRIT